MCTPVISVIEKRLPGNTKMRKEDGSRLITSPFLGGTCIEQSALPNKLCMFPSR